MESRQEAFFINAFPISVLSFWNRSMISTIRLAILLQTYAIHLVSSRYSARKEAPESFSIER